MDVIFTLDNIDDVARDFILHLDNLKVVAVNGSMGAGKTTFIQA